MLLIGAIIAGCSHPHAGIENAGGNLHWMAANGDIEGLRKSIQSGIDINTRDAGTNFTALHYAAWKGQYETAVFLIEQGANINAKTLYKNTPLHYAAGAESRCYDIATLSEGHLQTVKLLINQGARIDPRNGEGITPLQMAAGCDALEIARLLIAHGANVDNRSHQYSVLETAAAWSRDIAFLLIESGAKVDIFDKYIGT
jgi:ankyrin repeat protein